MADHGHQPDRPRGRDGSGRPPGPAGPPGPPGTGAAAQFGTGTQDAAEGHMEQACVLGEVLLTAGTVAHWVPAKGQLLPINQNQALFSLLGSRYGGNGTTTFALPDLTDAAPNGMTYSICVRGIFPARVE